MKNEFQTIKIYKKTTESIRDVRLVTNEGVAALLDRLVLAEVERTNASRVANAIREARSKYNKNG